MSSAAGRGPRGALLPGGGAGHAPSPAPPRLMRRLPAARTGTWAPRPRRGLGECGAGGRQVRARARGRVGGGQPGRVSVPCPEAAAPWPGRPFGGTLHVRGGFEESHGVTSRRARSFWVCAGVGLSVAGSPCDGAPGRAVSALVHAHVRRCVFVCARVRFEQTRNSGPPQTEPACVPQPHVLPVCQPRSGGDGAAPLKGSPPSESWTPPPPPPPPPRPLERGRESLFSFIRFSFSFLSVNYLFSAPGSERRGRAPPPAGRCGGAALRPRPRASVPGPGGRCAPRRRRARRTGRAAGPLGIGAPPRWGRKPVLENPRRSSVYERLVREGIGLGRVFAGRTACPEPVSMLWGWRRRCVGGWGGDCTCCPGGLASGQSGSLTFCWPSQPVGTW